MGWIILLIIVAVISFVLMSFFNAKKEQAIKIQQEGGMRKKYSQLVNSFLDANQNARVLQESYEAISLINSERGGSTVFELIQSFGKVTVQLKFKGLLGEYNLEWIFKEYDDQEEMLKIIAVDIQRKESEILNRRFK